MAKETGSLRTPLGILGGGQLGRMTIQAASTLAIDVVIGDGAAGSPAGRLAQREVIFRGGWNDPAAIEEMAKHAPTITLENEFVDADVLEQLESLGARVLPSPACIRTVQDKLRQKENLEADGIPVAPFRAVENPENLAKIGAELGWPLLLKARRGSYDGYGNALVRREDEVNQACERLGWPDSVLFAEGFVEFERELAVIVVRGQGGEMVTYPVVETHQDPERHICRTVLAPAPISSDISDHAAQVARSAVQAVGGVGTFGIELFLLKDGSILVNELAPRPHNTGHYSIEACVTSQFANHVRAVLGMPLGETAMREKAAAMVNLLGEGGPLPDHSQIAAAVDVPRTFLHIYGKSESRLGRKMGHVTAIGETVDETFERAQKAASRIKI